MAREPDQDEIERKQMVNEIHDLLAGMQSYSPMDGVQNDRVKTVLSRAAAMIETPRETKRRETGAK
jgi:hypothetical protein